MPVLHAVVSFVTAARSGVPYPRPIMFDDPRDPRTVDNLIARTCHDPRATEFLLDAPPEQAAIYLGVHVFTVEAARVRLRREELVEA